MLEGVVDGLTREVSLRFLVRVDVAQLAKRFLFPDCEAPFPREVEIALT